MTTEPRAVRCYYRNARHALIVWKCFCIVLDVFYLIREIFDDTYQTYHIYLLFCRAWLCVQPTLDILFLYGAMKRQSRILMVGFIYEIVQAVLAVIWYLLIIIMPSVFTEILVDWLNTSISSAMNSRQGSSMSSQQKQEIEQMRAIMNTGSHSLISTLVTSTIVRLIITLATQSMICYWYFIVYREAKRFQDNKVAVCAVGVVMKHDNYPNCPSYPAPNYPPCEKKTPMA